MAKHDLNGCTNPMTEAAARSIPNPHSTAPAGQGGTISVEGTPEVRCGSYADIATVRTAGTISTIDFAMIEGPSDDAGNLAAVLSARVIMSNENLISLRDMLNEHTKGWTA